MADGTRRNDRTPASGINHSDAHGATARGGGGGSYRSRSRPGVGDNVPPGVAGRDPSFQERYPALHEWLTEATLDGKPVFTATLLVFCEDGRWKACVGDRENDRSFFKSSESFQGLLEALEKALSDGSAEWRARGPKRR